MEQAKERERKAKNQRNYVRNNPVLVRRARERKYLTISQKKTANPLYEAEIRRKAREKKALQRLRKKLRLKESKHITGHEVNTISLIYL